MFRTSPLVVSFALLLDAGCTRTPEPPVGERAFSAGAPSAPVESARAAPSASVPLAAPAPRKPEPLAAPEPLAPLEVPGFRSAVVSLPLGATAKRPVVVALHGNYDRPEWQCEVWREITRAFPFVLCPRGIPRGDAPKSEDRWEYSSLTNTERELAAAMGALRAKYPEHVDASRVLYTGFSLGAILGKSLVVNRGGNFERAVFIEGGFEAFGRARAKQFVEAGVTRVLFACGQASCVQAAKSAARALEREGASARVVSGGNAGHTYDGAVARAISSEWSWLTEGDERWAESRSE